MDGRDVRNRMQAPRPDDAMIIDPGCGPASLPRPQKTRKAPTSCSQMSRFAARRPPPVQPISAAPSRRCDPNQSAMTFVSITDNVGTKTRERR